MTLLSEIEQYLSSHIGLSAKSFGAAAGCSPSVIYDWRAGSNPRPETLKKLRDYLESGPVHNTVPCPDRERPNAATLPRIQGDGYPCGHCGQARLGCEHRPLDFYV